MSLLGEFDCSWKMIKICQALAGKVVEREHPGSDYQSTSWMNQSMQLFPARRLQCVVQSCRMLKADSISGEIYRIPKLYKRCFVNNHLNGDGFEGRTITACYFADKVPYPLELMRKNMYRGLTRYLNPKE